MVNNGQYKGKNSYLFFAIVFMCTGFLLPVGIFMGILYLWSKFFGEGFDRKEYNSNALEEYA
jgi:hypothetical protein